MIPVPGAGFVYSLLNEIGISGVARVRVRRLPPPKSSASGQNGKRSLNDKIYEMRKQKLREEVIIRDLNRVDSYPDFDDKAKGISPWFRAGLVGTYHKGALIGLRWTTLTADAKGDWRFTDYKKGETGDINVIPIGYVPFENIESVDWRGGEY